jgi:hyperosmotically inducible protein
MKKAFLLLLIGAVAGAVGWHYFQLSQHPTIGQRADALADKARDAATDTKDAVTGKSKDWHLNSESIKEELAKTSQVVRSKASSAGEIIDDARITTVIKGKYVLDKNLSVLAISVSCQDGEVRLTGSVTSVELIGRAVTLALETSGVHNVVSQLVVRP